MGVTLEQRLANLKSALAFERARHGRTRELRIKVEYLQKRITTKRLKAEIRNERNGSR